MIKLVLRGLILLSLILIAPRLYAQNNFIITGKVTDESYNPLAGATVFIDGSKIATATDTSGGFKLIVPGAGSYNLSVKLLGYASANKDIMLKKRAAIANFNLAVKPYVLNQVNIGTDKNWKANFEIFKIQFLGTTPNAAQCKIINPEVINFSTKKGLLIADADEFLIVENPKLGYRIKYLLKTFQYNKIFARTSYNGDVVFEELPGTDVQKQAWATNRLQAYRGSMMHFLRSVFTNTILKEGFIVSRILKTSNGQQYYENKPLKFEDYITANDTSFVTFTSVSIHVVYNPEKAAKLLAENTISPMVDAGKTNYSSDLLTYAKEVVIDASGRVFSGYLLSFLIRGDWTYKRVGDQLPFEYQPSSP